MPTHSSRLFWAAALLALAASGCRVPNFRGAQIQEPPQGFLLQNESYQNRRMFPERDVTMHSAWIKASDGPYSGIYINAHQGDITVEDVMDAQDVARALPDNALVTFGQVEPLKIDGRTAWGWSEMLATPERGLDWVAYRTVVSYDTASYAIEFYSGDPNMKLQAPDTLKAVLATFGVGRTEWNLPLIAILVGLTLLALSLLRKRSEEQAARLANINLVQVAKPGADSEMDGPANPSVEEPSGPPPAATPPPPPASPTVMSGSRSGPE